MPLPLTKSRYILALECPAKLYYHSHPNRYDNESLADPFLCELAKGGFQVGALAQCYFPGGIPFVKEDNSQIDHTLKYLQQENVILYEAPIGFDNYHVRVDILEKRGNELYLYEVKAKSFSPKRDRFRDANGEIIRKWQDKLYDVTFQYWVIKEFLRRHNLHLNIWPHLVLVNKDIASPVDGINQLFFFNTKTGIVDIDATAVDIVNQTQHRLLSNIPVHNEVTYILEQPTGYGTFADEVEVFSNSMLNSTKINGIPAKTCKACEFRSDDPVRSGFHECWTQIAGFTQTDFDRPLVWDVWNFRKTDALFAQQRYFIDQVDHQDLVGANGDPYIGPGMSPVARQEMQVMKVRGNDASPHVCKDDLRAEIAQWKYPYHFIDFETSAVALPFHRGMHPYEMVAFQFSHHILYADGRIEHAHEWLQPERGLFPNFEFVRNLQKALTGDNGSVFRYAAHENTALNTIHRQLDQSTATDKKSLMDFIETLTCLRGRKGYLRYGDRCMIDLCEIIKKYYYHPHAKGSNSIKYILPAMMQTSTALHKYSEPIYGTTEMPSHNFNEKTWMIRYKDVAQDPYTLLPPIFSTNDDAILDKMLMDGDADLQNGGAAMAAYGLLQFSRMSQEEERHIRQSLLRYCELDTLAMVMLVEELLEQIKN